MEKIILGALFAIIPVINFVLAYYYSKKDGKLHLFKNHINFYYSDWLFVPFNFLMVFTVSFSYLWALVLFIFSIFCSFVVNFLWFVNTKKSRNEEHMFNFKTRRLTNAGFVHSLFLLFELFLILYFVIFSLNNVFSLINLILLLVYFSTFPIASKRIHGKFVLGDILVFSLGLIVLVLKLLLFLR